MRSKQNEVFSYRAGLGITSAFIGCSVAFLVIVGFWPRPLSSIAMTFRAPLFSTAVVGQKIELKTITQLDSLMAAEVPPTTALWIGGRNEHLAVIVSGLVGSAEDTLNIFMANEFIAAGTSVMILPSPTQWAFAHRRLPEVQRADYDFSVGALCVAMDEVLRSPVVQMSIGPKVLKRAYMVGLSLGARHAVSLADCVADRAHLQDLRILGVNPPVDLRFAGATIDQLVARLADNRTRAYGVGLLLQSIRPLVPWLGIDTALRPLGWFPEALEELAAASFAARMERVQTGRETRFDGISTRRSDFSFRDFMDRGPVKVEDFQREVRSARLKTRNHLYVIHSTDDFLVRSSDLDFLRKELGDRAKILTSGGHGGLVFEFVFQEMVQRMIGEP